MNRTDSILRVAVGGVLVAGALLKALAYGSPAYENTLAWEMLGGSHALLALLASVEALLGSMLILRLGGRAPSVALFFMVVVFSGAVVWNWVSVTSGSPDQVVRACGCMGVGSVAQSSSIGVTLAFNAVLACGIVLGERSR